MIQAKFQSIIICFGIVPLRFTSLLSGDCQVSHSRRIAKLSTPTLMMMRPAAEKADDTARESAEGNAFDIEDIIDVDNLDMRDTLSDMPISKPKLLPKEKQPTSVVAAAKELVESDWVL